MLSRRGTYSYSYIYIYSYSCCVQPRGRPRAGLGPAHCKFQCKTSSNRTQVWNKAFRQGRKSRNRPYQPSGSDLIFYPKGLGLDSPDRQSLTFRLRLCVRLAVCSCDCNCLYLVCTRLCTPSHGPTCDHEHICVSCATDMTHMRL